MKHRLNFFALAAVILCVSYGLSQVGHSQSVSQVNAAVNMIDPRAGGGNPPMAMIARGIVDESGRLVLHAVAGAEVHEGATINLYQTSVGTVDPTADRTQYRPNASGIYTLAQAATVVAVTGDNQAVTPGTSTFITFTSDDATGTNRTITLSATGATVGERYTLVAPATNALEMADSGTAVLSAAWSPNANDTLTLIFDGTNFLEVSRSAN